MVKLKVTHEVDPSSCYALVCNKEIFIVFINHKHSSADPSKRLDINAYITFMIILWLVLYKSKEIIIRFRKCILYAQNLPTPMQLNFIHILKIIKFRNASTLNCSFWEHTTLPRNKSECAHQLLILISAK